MMKVLRLLALAAFLLIMGGTADVNAVDGNSPPNFEIGETVFNRMERREFLRGIEMTNEEAMQFAGTPAMSLAQALAQTVLAINRELARRRREHIGPPNLTPMR